MKLLGVTIDKDLNFTDHVADIVRRVSNQIQVMLLKFVVRHIILIFVTSFYGKYGIERLSYDFEN